MGAAALPLMILSSGMQALGGYQANQAQAEQYTMQSNIARINAGIATQNAAYASQAGNAEAEQAGLKTKFNVADIKAIQGASGLDVNTGSAVDVRESASKAGMLDALTIRSNAARAAYGYENQAFSDTLNSNISKAAATNSKTASYTKALGSLIGGASSVSNAAKQWQQTTGKNPFDFTSPEAAGGISDFGDAAGPASAVFA